MALTAVGGAAAWILSLGLLATLAVGPSLELGRVLQGQGTIFSGEPAVASPPPPAPADRVAQAAAVNERWRLALDGLERRVSLQSALAVRLRPWAQRLLVRYLEYGNTQVVVGRQGHLYFEPALTSLWGPGFLEPDELARRSAASPPGAPFDPDPVKGLARLHRDLARRGIHLLFLPVPVKAAIHPEPLLRGAPLEPGSAPLANRSFGELRQRLARQGVEMLDPARALWAASRRGETVYTATDTHWNPRGMQITARLVARFLETHAWLPPRPPAGLERHRVPFEFSGDLVGLLGLVPTGALPREQVTLWEVTGPNRVPLASSPPGDVLLLGDSYSLILSARQTGHATGFADQLALELDRPVRSFAKPGLDIASCVHALQDSPALLEGVRVVVYEVTARALSLSNWVETPLDGAP